MLPEPLPVGDYELHEVAAPYGYVLSNEPCRLLLTAARRL